MKDCASTQSLHKLISAGMGKHFNCQKGVSGGGTQLVKLTVDCLGSQTDQKLNSCLTFHSKNWILHLAKKFAVRRISSSSSSNGSAAAAVESFLVLQLIYQISEIYAALFVRLEVCPEFWLSGLPARFRRPPKQNKGPAIFNYGSNQHIYNHRTPLSLPVPVPVLDPDLSLSPLPNAETNPLVNLLIARGFRFNCDRRFDQMAAHKKPGQKPCKEIPEKNETKRKPREIKKKNILIKC